MEYEWLLREPSRALKEMLQTELQIEQLLAAALVNRGMETASAASVFLDPKLRNLRDPFLIPELERAVGCIWEAIRMEHRIVIFGDYDVDGITATAILVETLEQLGAEVSAYLPNRKDEGYGLTRAGLEGCLELRPQLLIAVDCGSNSEDLIDWMRKEHQVPTIVLDHHQIITPAKSAMALVNCLLSKNEEDHVLCSAGLAFKMAHALVKKGRNSGEEKAASFDLKMCLDFVALGTIADHVPLRFENRIFVSAGLKALCNSKRPGLVALKQLLPDSDKVDCHTVSFQLAPRLNASGRLESAKASLDLLLAKDAQSAEEFAKILEKQNEERREIERITTAAVLSLVREKYKDRTPRFILEANPKWHIGVIGIVASRVVSEFHVPVIIAGGEGELLRGSGRTIEGCDLVSCLQDCADLLGKFGGHAMAAGISVHPDKVKLLQSRLHEVAIQKFGEHRPLPPIHIDQEVLLSDITFKAVEELQSLAPTGNGNEPFKLVVRNVHHQRPPQRMGKELQHVKCWVTDGIATVQAVKWNVKNESVPKVAFDLVATPSLNEYNGSTSVQLTILDWKTPAKLEQRTS